MCMAQQDNAHTWLLRVLLTRLPDDLQRAQSGVWLRPTGPLAASSLTCWSTGLPLTAAPLPPCIPLPLRITCMGTWSV